MTGTRGVGGLKGLVNKALNTVADTTGVVKRHVNALDAYGETANEKAKAREANHVYGNHFSNGTQREVDVSAAQKTIERLSAQLPAHVQKIELLQDEFGSFVKATVSAETPDIEGLRKNLQQAFDDSAIGVHTVLPRETLPASIRELPFSCEIPKARVAAERLFGFFVSMKEGKVLSATDFLTSVGELSAKTGVVLLPRDIALLGGAMNGAAVEVEGKEFTLRSGCYFGKGFFEEFPLDEGEAPVKALYGKYAEVPPHAPKGYATRVLRRQLEYMKALGFEALSLIAGKSDSYNGYYTWPRIGFNGKIPEESSRLMLSQAETNPKSAAARIVEANGGIPPATLVQLMATYELNAVGKPVAMGADWWKEFGVADWMAFDLRDASESWTAMNIYTDMRKVDDWDAPGESIAEIDRQLPHSSKHDGMVTRRDGEYSFLQLAFQDTLNESRSLDMSKFQMVLAGQSIPITGMTRFSDGQLGSEGPPPVVFDRGYVGIQTNLKEGTALARWYGTTLPYLPPDNP